MTQDTLTSLLFGIDIFDPTVWLTFGLLLVFLELIVPSYLFIGLGGGAWCVALALWVATPLYTASPYPEALLFVTFALSSFLCWFALRNFSGVTRFQSQRFDSDINVLPEDEDRHR